MSTDKHELYPGTEAAEPQAKATGVDFNNGVMNSQVAKNLGIRKGALKEVLLPEIGTKFVLRGLVYRVSYVRANPFRIAAEPIGVVKDEEEKKS